MPQVRTITRAKIRKNARYPLSVGRNNTIPDHVLLATTGGSQLRTLVGPQHQTSYTGNFTMPDGSVKAVPVDTNGLYCGPGVTNLLSNVTPTTESKTLTVQKYCLQVFGAGASCTMSGANTGTATLGLPLFFTASAGSTTFTPTNCTSWMLSAAGGYAYPYTTPATTNPSAAGSTGNNGCGWPLTGSVKADRVKACMDTGGVFTLAATVRMGVGSGELTTVSDVVFNTLSSNNIIYSDLYFIYGTTSGQIITSYDGVHAALLSDTWNRSAIHRKIVQTNAVGTQFRIGYQRLTATGTLIDANPVYSSWGAYDGSMNPLTMLRLALNSTVPMHLIGLGLSNKSLDNANTLRMIRRYENGCF